MKIELNANFKQCEIMKETLELYSRMGMGQFSALAELSFMRSKSVTSYMRNAVVSRLKYSYFPELEAEQYYGISHEKTPEDCKIAYDILQVLRNKMAWHKHPEGGLTIQFDEPLRCSTTEKLCECEINNDVVTLKLSEKQAIVVWEALEFYARIGTGQIIAVDSLKFLFERRHEELSVVEMNAEMFKAVYFPELRYKGLYHAIQSDNTPMECKIAYDMVKVIRHDISWFKEPQGGVGVNFFKPGSPISSEPLCTTNIHA